MRNRRLAWAGCLLVALAGALLLQAQSSRKDDTSSRTVQGVVTDSSGNPVKGANVQLKDTKTLQIRSFYAKDDGSYHFAGLSSNVDYELKASYQGASSGTKTLSAFDGHKQATIDLKLKK